MARIPKGENFKNILGGLNRLSTWATTKPEGAKAPGRMSNIGTSIGKGVSGAYWRNRTPLGKLRNVGLTALPTYLIGKSALNSGMFGLQNQSDFNEANLPFVTQSDLAKKAYEQQVESLNKIYGAEANDQAKALNDLYGALGYTAQDIYEQAAKDMANIGGGMSDAEYNAAINAAYSMPASEVAARASAPTGTEMSGMTATPTAGQMSASDMRNLGKSQADLLAAERALGQQQLDMGVQSAQNLSRTVPAELRLLGALQASGIQSQLAAEKRKALSGLLADYSTKQLETRGLAPIQLTQPQIQQALNEFNKLSKSQQTSYLKSNLTPAELATYKGRGMSDTEIYVALRNGLI